MWPHLRRRVHSDEPLKLEIATWLPWTREEERESEMAGKARWRERERESLGGERERESLGGEREGETTREREEDGEESSLFVTDGEGGIGGEERRRRTESEGVGLVPTWKSPVRGFQFLFLFFFFLKGISHFTHHF